MICFIALAVFAFLGIFSAYYRQLAKEAFGCVFNKIKLKPCDSGLDMRIKGELVGKLMNTSPTTAKITYKHFELISWIFFVTFLLSFGYTAYGFYNYVAYGNCNGPDSSAFCIFNTVSNTLGDGTVVNTTQEKCYTSIYDYNSSLSGYGGENGA